MGRHIGYGFEPRWRHTFLNTFFDFWRDKSRVRRLMNRFTHFFRNRKSRKIKKKILLFLISPVFKVWHIKKRGIKRAFQHVWFRDSAMVRSRVMAILHVSFHVFGEYLRDITPKGSPVLEKYLRDVIGRPLSRCTCVGSQRMRLFCMFVVSLFQQLIDVI